MSAELKVTINWTWDDAARVGYLDMTEGADKFVKRTEFIETTNAIIALDYGPNGDILGIEVMA